MKRREAREFVLQLLYQHEFNPQNPEKSLREFWELIGMKSGEDYVERVFTGILSNKIKIDTLIEESSTNWRLDRMSVIDRNILRVSTYELLFDASIPDKVSINEAIEISKKFGSEDSSAFINGILNKILIGNPRQ